VLQVKLREKGQVTIPVEVLQEWRLKNQVNTNDFIDVSLSNGVLMLIPSKRAEGKRDLLSFAGSGRGLWGNTEQEIESSIAALRNSWSR
jgi:bifunctional DNA-binding transcriptional regulator/antitoxin component of YhaV-PrlF toxin-antitoxin module